MKQEYMDRITSATFPATATKLRAEQVAQRTTWTAVPDTDVADAAMHVIHIVPAGASTSTVVNAMDPATLDDTHAARAAGYLIRPEIDGPVVPAGKQV